MANRGCNLECVSEGDTGDVVEFVGPVKIILVNQPKRLYVRKRCAAALIVFAHMMMGAAIVIVVYYSLSFSKKASLKGLHIFLGTVGLQLCMPLAILSLHKLSGSTVPVKLAHRQFEHAFLQVCGIVCTMLAGAASYFCGYFDFTIHSILGCGTVALAICNSIVGLLIYDYTGKVDKSQKGIIRRCVTKFHQFFGIISFMGASSCFVSGVIKKTFIDWTTVPEILVFTIVFCAFYTAIILYKPIKETFLVWYIASYFGVSNVLYSPVYFRYFYLQSQQNNFYLYF